ncbi:hypothetical protein LTR36_002631 [Oleoguttula mirabilis]|uniref:Cytochrome P450 n=1 Tax=Oleoguttula mirabilis TaxID=1507867 RepID=A0AAV9JKH2_9PEZI|nr:hypothetical protein LTR36_002631 [Oleoguttula mirabilis]
MALIQISVLVTAFIFYRVITSLLRERRFKAFATQHGCAEPEDVTEPWYQRHKRLQRVLAIKKSGEDIIDDIIGSDFRDSNTAQRRAFEGSKTILTIEPANLQAVLATQFKDFETGHIRYQQLSPILGRSIFTSDGAFWEHSRALFRPQFARDNINDLESTDRAASALIEALGPTDASGWTPDGDMLPLFFNFTLDTASEFLFGESVDSQTLAMKAKVQQNSEAYDVEKAGSAGMQATSEQFRDDLVIVGDHILTRIRMQSLYWVGDSLRFRKAIRSAKRFTECVYLNHIASESECSLTVFLIRYFVQRAIDAAKLDKVDGEKANLLAKLATQSQDREELRDQTLAILFAGRDTTASLLGFCFVRLALHPDILKKLRGTLLTDFVPGKPVTFAQLKSCRYLQHFLNEVLRLHPTVPLNARVAARDTTLPVGGGKDQSEPVAVRKGETIGYSVYLMHRRKDLWGEDASEFKPERWEQRIPAWQFLPFNGGPRICLGQQFALTEASYVLVRLLREFDSIEPVDRAQMLRFKKGLGLTMWPGDGVKVRLHKA